MKTLLASTALLFASTVAHAQQYATITDVKTNYETSYQNTTTQQCYDVEVPVYGNVQGGNAGEGALGGMIIGGLLGKGVTGNDQGAAAGAIIGGIIGADNAQNSTRRVITGYRIERQCDQVANRKPVRTVKNYRITYVWNGVRNRSYTYNHYRVGDRIPITVTINAN
jgi:uncharacterized protein YcfJ